jgi:hypothetical protein
MQEKSRWKASVTKSWDMDLSEMFLINDYHVNSTKNTLSDTLYFLLTPHRIPPKNLLESVG